MGGGGVNKKILDVTYGSRTIWFDKRHTAAVYCDKRDEEYTGTGKENVFREAY